jgi:glycosyltransferase domain-containing protein
MNEYLTLIVPLFDRHELTDRVLSSLDEQKCEFKIIVADGSFEKFEDEEIEYKNLDIEYFYDEPDVSIAKFMKKMGRASERIETPFCMIFDNDDLIDLSGIRNGIKFMSSHPDYSCYQNDVRTLDVHPEIDLKDSLYQNNSIEQSDPAERLDDAISNFNSFNYAIFRTSYIKSFFKMLDVLDNDDFQFFQKSWAYTSAILGKCERLQNESYYYFIPGESTLQDGRIHKFSRWADTRYWPESCPKIISMIYNLYKHLYNSDIRLRFAKNFIDEIIKKGNYDHPENGYVDKICEMSLQYDEQTRDAVSAFCINNDTFDYSCDEKASHEEFLKCLNM